MDMIIRNLFICIVVLASCNIAFGQDSYRSVDENLKLDVIHSDPKAFFISMDMRRPWCILPMRTVTRRPAVLSNPHRRVRRSS